MIDRPGRRKEVFFQFTDGSLTTINHSVQDAETFQNVNSRKHWIVSKQWIHLEEDGMVLLFLGFLNIFFVGLFFACCEWPPAFEEVDGEDTRDAVSI